MKNDKNSVLLENIAIEKLMNSADRQEIKSEIEKWITGKYKLSKEPQKTLNFGDANLIKLSKIVNIEQADNDSKFDNWFSYKYEISKEDESYLKNLIKKNKLFLSAYNEEQLKVKFIAPVLNKVDFFFDNIKDWYEYWLSATVNNVLFRGKTDFMIAKGIDEPEIPYFLLQEYKKSINFTGNPKYQLLVAMIAAIELNNVNTLSGCYIIGRTWFFVILEKLDKIIKKKEKN